MVFPVIRFAVGAAPPLIMVASRSPMPKPLNGAATLGTLPLNRLPCTAVSVVPSSAMATPLTGGAVKRRFLAADGVTGPVGEDGPDAIEQVVPLSLLRFLAAQVPVGFRATNLLTGEADFANFVLRVTP